MKIFTAASLMTALFGLIFLSASGFAAKGGEPGKPTGGEAGNNLSYPSIRIDGGESREAEWSVATESKLGIHYSYGCDVAESNEPFNYPNTSCVDNLSEPTAYYEADVCADEGKPCAGLSVDRIYWQKVADNQWWADDESISGPVDVEYIDWGDALEAVSWNERSVIRVETQPYSSTLSGFDPTAGSCADFAGDPESDCKVGFLMWHVSGQGIDEQWGVRASDGGTSYNYDSPFQVINSANARLNLTKMAPGAATCSQPGEGGEGEDPPVSDLGDWVTGTEPGTKEWQGTCTYLDIPYSVETSVGGKYVYGYNWRMKDVDLSKCGDEWLKTGYWRLTFYSADQSVNFANFNIQEIDKYNVAPPAIPSEVRALPQMEFNTAVAEPPVTVESSETESEDPDADDRLYKPVVDTINNLSYIDICIVSKDQGGGSN